MDLNRNGWIESASRLKLYINNFVTNQAKQYEAAMSSRRLSSDHRSSERSMKLDLSSIRSNCASRAMSRDTSQDNLQQYLPPKQYRGHRRQVSDAPIKVPLTSRRMEPERSKHVLNTERHHRPPKQENFKENNPYLANVLKKIASARRSPTYRQHIASARHSPRSRHHERKNSHPTIKNDASSPIEQYHSRKNSLSNIKIKQDTSDEKYHSQKNSVPQVKIDLTSPTLKYHSRQNSIKDMRSAENSPQDPQEKQHTRRLSLFNMQMQDNSGSGKQHQRHSSLSNLILHQNSGHNTPETKRHSRKNSLYNLKINPDSPTQKRQHQRWNSTSSIKIDLKTSAVETDREKMRNYITKYWGKFQDAPKTSSAFYKMGKMIGKGAFGNVILGTNKLTGLNIAAKVIEKTYMKDEYRRKKVQQEIMILQRINHKHVVRILEVFESREQLFIVTEYVGGGDMLAYVRLKRRLSEQQARHLFRQIIWGVAACHKIGVLHRDIKLDNLLISADHQQIKICDFGISRILRKGEKVYDQCGTPAYIAPEILADRGYEGFNSDIWSLGVLLYAMVVGTVPFKAPNMSELNKMIFRGTYTLPENISSTLGDLIKKMLCLVPTNRIQISDMLGHRWMRDESPEYRLLQRFELEQGMQKLEIDEKTVNRVRALGYPRDYILRSLKGQDMNHATACYYLLINSPNHN